MNTIKEINDFILNIFTGKDESRSIMMFPNLKDGIVYASDCLVLIAIPQDELSLSYGTNDKYPNAEKLFSKFENIEHKKSIKVKVADLAKGLVKARIETDKYLVKCKDCNGNGEVEWIYEDKEYEKHYQEFECPVCDGEGDIEYRHPFPRIYIPNTDEADLNIEIRVDNLKFHPFQLYRIFMVALMKGATEIDLLYDAENSESGCFVQIGNIRMIVMPLKEQNND